MLTEFLKISDRIWVLPVIHGSGDYALEVRRVMLEQSFDCLAVPLPPSFQEPVEAAITHLPAVTAVVQPEYSPLSWERPDEDEADLAASYVPVDPCQPVIAALRIALQEHMPRAFIDFETDDYTGVGSVFPDPYALKRVSPDHFAAAVLPSLPEISEGQPGDRVAWLASRLRALETRFESILFVCSVMDWPWIKDAYFDRRETTVTL